MVRQTIVFTADERQRKLVESLGGKVVQLQSDCWSEQIEDWEMSEKVYVLPIPLSKLDNKQGLKMKLKQELINNACDRNVSVKVFAGVITEEWESFFEDHGICYVDLMKLPEVVEGNAYITAEATLAEVLVQSAYSICGQTILVTGYGCCGKTIADLFSRLGANVIVVARREEVCEEARRNGHKAILFSVYDQVVAGNSSEVSDIEWLDDIKTNIKTVINTVPARVIQEAHIRALSSDACIIDIASKPGGTDFEAAEKYGITAKLALGLPGIYTTTSSALLLKNAISKYAPLSKNVSEDKLWIFQIII